jgi:hypothetical protein
MRFSQIETLGVGPGVGQSLASRHPYIEETERSRPVRVKVYLATIMANIGANVCVGRTQFRHQGGRSEGALTSQPSDVNVIQPQPSRAVAAEIQQWNAIIVILEVARAVIAGIRVDTRSEIYRRLPCEVVTSVGSP